MTLKEKWDSYDAHFDDIFALSNLLAEELLKCERNIEHSYSNNVWVKKYLDGEEIEPIKSVDEFNQFMEEGSCYVTEAVTDTFFSENGYESDDEEEQYEERNAVFDTLWHNVVQMYCNASYEAIDDMLEDIKNQRYSDCIEPYETEFSNALDDVCFDYDYQTWYKSNGQTFENEDDAKFIWDCAFYRLDIDL